MDVGCSEVVILKQLISLIAPGRGAAPSLAERGPDKYNLVELKASTSLLLSEDDYLTEVEGGLEDQSICFMS